MIPQFRSQVPGIEQGPEGHLEDPVHLGRTRPQRIRIRDAADERRQHEPRNDGLFLVERAQDRHILGPHPNLFGRLPQGRIERRLPRLHDPTGQATADPDDGDGLVRRRTALRWRDEGGVHAGPGPERVMVFQEFSLFRWRTVRRNIEFALECNRVPKNKRAPIIERLLRQVAHPQRLPGVHRVEF